MKCPKSEQMQDDPDLFFSCFMGQIYLASRQKYGELHSQGFLTWLNYLTSQKIINFIECVF